MRTIPVLVLILLAGLIGCKKRGSSERTIEDVLGLNPGVGGVDREPPLPLPPATYPATLGGRLAEALDKSAALANKGADWRPPLEALLKVLPKEEVGPKSAPRGGDATAERGFIDAGFERLWRADYRLPEI